MIDAPRIDGVERLRQRVKWILFRVLAGGDAGRYVDLRRRAMRILGALGLYERDHIGFLQQVVRPGDLVVDVGAHFGVYTVALSALVGARGKVHAFEPQSLVHGALKDTALPHANTEFHRVALSNRAGTQTLRIPFVLGDVPEPALATLERIAPPFLVDTMTTRTLDSYEGLLHGLRFVKVDVEGHELAFLDGAREVLLRERPLVQLEDNSGGGRLAQYLAEGRLPGYTLATLADGRLRRFPAAAKGRINFYLVPAPAGEPDDADPQCVRPAGRPST